MNFVKSVFRWIAVFVSGFIAGGAFMSISDALILGGSDMETRANYITQLTAWGRSMQ